MSFELMETTVAQVHAAMKAGELTCRQLVEMYLARIEAYDQKGPAINSVITVNPKALEEADACDAYLKEHGEFNGPLHGIPVMLKDNCNTTDMPTTAGSVALKGWVPPTDAFVTKRIRESGATILAKTNLHEFAIWGESVSSILGQAVNPYDPTRTPGGSSGGTGATIASNIGIIGIGTDTINSIRSPSSANSLVGIRPTIGLVSRAGIVPYSLTQDTAGPICRTVEDAVRCLDVIAGYDPDDDETAWCVGKVPATYMNALKVDGMRGKRIGVLESLFGKEEVNKSTNEVVYNALKVFEENGATLVPVKDNIDQPYLTTETSVHLDDFKEHLDSYLNTLPPEWPIHSMAEILDAGLFHENSEGNMRDAMKLGVGTPRYLEKMYNKIGVKTHIMKIMADLELDAMVYPHQQQLVCKIGGSQQQRNGVLCSSCGLPSIAVPAGFAPSEDAPIGVPVGMEIIGRPWSEELLIEIAYSFEQHSHFRKPPVSAPAL
ncbi:MAG: amidase [Oscillospiraceae bacterium]|nr:amidase [Oscillospiraceae bacterium]